VSKTQGVTQSCGKNRADNAVILIVARFGAFSSTNAKGRDSVCI
jgi:hypothetical protein